MATRCKLRLAAICCLILVGNGLASSSGNEEASVATSRRGRTHNLLDEMIEAADGQGGGQVADWVVDCEQGRLRCPNLFLASWGYQCVTWDGKSCCEKPGGQRCKSLEHWKDADVPTSWRGREMAAATPAASDATATADAPTTAAATDTASDTASKLSIAGPRLEAGGSGDSRVRALAADTPAASSLAAEADSTDSTTNSDNSTSTDAANSDSGDEQPEEEQQHEEKQQKEGQRKGRRGNKSGEKQADSEVAEEQTDEKGSKEEADSEAADEQLSDKKEGRRSRKSGNSKSGSSGSGEGSKRRGRKEKDGGEEDDEEEGEDDSSSSSSSSSKKKKKKSRKSSGEWRHAAATHYTSYPPCCHDSSADRSECDDYSGCKWEGMFKGLDNKQSKSWVEDNNLVAVFEAPNSRNRKEWDRKWKNKKLRIKHPDTGKTLEVRVVDTCDDSDCSGCCTENASRGGGMLLDLEINTARRFWGKSKVRDVSKIEFEVLADD